MKKGLGTKKIIAITMMCCCLFHARIAQAFVWPCIDIVQISSFVSSITNGLSTISNAKSQLDNVRATIKSVGDQITTMKKYAKTIAEIRENINNIVVNVTTAIEDIKDTVNYVEQNINEILEDVEVEEAIALTLGVEYNISNGASEEDIQTMVEDAKTQSEANKAKVNEILDEAQTNISKTLDDAGTAVDMLVSTVKEHKGISEETKEGLNSRAEGIKKEINTLKEEASEIINQLKEDYNEEYSEKIAGAYDSYSKAISDYYAGKIDMKALKDAGNALKESVASVSTAIDTSVMDKFITTADKIVEDINTLEDEILNAISNDKEYSDEDDETDEVNNVITNQTQDNVENSNTENETGEIKRPNDLIPFINQKGNIVEPTPFSPNETLPKNSLLKFENIIDGIGKQNVYSFKYKKENMHLYAKSVYNKGAKGKPFIISKEFLCKDFDLDAVAKLKEDSGDFRTCVARAKMEFEYYPDAEKDKLYKKYLNVGVYKHILDDYSAANLITASKMKQEVISWRGDAEGNKDKSEYEQLKKQLSKGDVDNAKDGVVAMGMIDLWAPRLWSFIRRVDAVNRGKNVVQMFELDETLHIDGRDDDVTDALRSKPGEITVNGESKKIFPHVMLHHCGLKAEDISMNKEEGSPKELEQKLYNCMKMYASGASRGITEGNTVSSDTEEAKKVWKEKQKMALNDAAFENLTLSVITNYNSSQDYKRDLEGDQEVNIITLQDGLKDVSQARDGYAAAAQINYYATQQLLNIVDTDALDLQMEILKDLQTYDYSYFQSSDE